MPTRRVALPQCTEQHPEAIPRGIQRLRTRHRARLDAGRAKAQATASSIGGPVEPTRHPQQHFWPNHEAPSRGGNRDGASGQQDKTKSPPQAAGLVVFRTPGRSPGHSAAGQGSAVPDAADRPPPLRLRPFCDNTNGGEIGTAAAP